MPDGSAAPARTPFRFDLPIRLEKRPVLVIVSESVTANALGASLVVGIQTYASSGVSLVITIDSRNPPHAIGYANHLVFRGKAVHDMTAGWAVTEVRCGLACWSRYQELPTSTAPTSGLPQHVRPKPHTAAAVAK